VLDHLLPFAVAAGLGLLVGFQRERSRGVLAGARTFPLIALAGAICAHLARSPAGPWILPAGLLAVTALVAAGYCVTCEREGADPGLTTEVAALVMFLVGALSAAGYVPLAVVVGGGVAALLQLKHPMHRLAERLSDDDVRALMRIVVIGLVILPALPDRTYGPYDVLNPFRIWLMVVLIVGISVASWVLHRLMDARSGTLLAGLLGGLVSSTATTASYARQTGSSPALARTTAAVVMIASTVIFARIFVEVSAVAPGLLGRIGPPLATMAAINVGLCAVGVARIGGAQATASDPDDPTELRAALFFGLLYGAVLFAVAAAREHLGDVGLYAVATLSGLTDVDAITLSVAQLSDEGRIGTDTAWRAILLATLANLVFKAGLAFVLGGPPLLRNLAVLFVPSIAAGAALLAFWP